jgi:hypothetical protein
MKKQYFTFLAALFIAVSIFGQAPEKTSILEGNNQKMAPVPSAPEKISYQAVVRDANKAIVANQDVGMRISVLQNTLAGTAVYVETQTPTTNANGLLSIYIGAGTVGSGVFSDINWSTGSYFIKIEIDTAGGTSYNITGTTAQLVSVPYALYAKVSAAGTLTGPALNATVVGSSLTSVGTLTDLTVAGTSETGLVKITGGTPGVGKVLTSDADGLAGWQDVAAVEVTLTGAETLSNKTLTSPKIAAISNTGTLTLPTITGTIALTSDIPEGQSSGTTTGDMQYWNGTAWAVVAATPNEGATLQMIAGIPTWVGGTPPPAVGDFRYGGVVFWVNPSDNTHGLVCAIEDQSSGIRWYNGNYTTTGATGNAIGAGSANTAKIIASQGATETAYAAGLARAYNGGGYTDWFLPSRFELNQMHTNKATINTTATANSGSNFTNNYYWSSTEYGFYEAFFQVFSSGSQYWTDKNYTNGHVRAVRAF